MTRILLIILVLGLLSPILCGIWAVGMALYSVGGFAGFIGGFFILVLIFEIIGIFSEFLS